MNSCITFFMLSCVTILSTQRQLSRGSLNKAKPAQLRRVVVKSTIKQKLYTLKTPTPVVSHRLYCTESPKVDAELPVEATTITLRDGFVVDFTKLVPTEGEPILLFQDTEWLTMASLGHRLMGLLPVGSALLIWLALAKDSVAQPWLLAVIVASAVSLTLGIFALGNWFLTVHAHYIAFEPATQEIVLKTSSVLGREKLHRVHIHNIIPKTPLVNDRVALWCNRPEKMFWDRKYFTFTNTGEVIAENRWLLEMLTRENPAKKVVETKVEEPFEDTFF